MAEKISGALLKGLTFRGANTKKVKEENGREREVSAPYERELKPDDVLSWKDYGDEVVIVSNDGRKHRVVKKEK